MLSYHCRLIACNIYGCLFTQRVWIVTQHVLKKRSQIDFLSASRFATFKLFNSFLMFRPLTRQIMLQTHSVLFKLWQQSWRLCVIASHSTHPALWGALDEEWRKSKWFVAELTLYQCISQPSWNKLNLCFRCYLGWENLRTQFAYGTRDSDDEWIKLAEWFHPTFNKTNYLRQKNSYKFLARILIAEDIGRARRRSLVTVTLELASLDMYATTI